MDIADKSTGRETIKRQRSNTKMKHERDITTHPLNLQVVHRTIVPSHAENKRDVRYGNTLNTCIVSKVCISH